jgi:aminoglycoside 6'-N-acetyltransferase I
MLSMNAPAIRIREATEADQAEWIALRCLLWPGSDADHHAKVPLYFSQRDARGVTLVALTADDANGVADSESKLVGFLELGSRSYAEGCETSPVAYIEGWFVDSAYRRQGIGRALVRAAEEWAVRAGYEELASDVELDNDASLSAHAALGFEKQPAIVPFRKSLGRRAG